jgi:uncharacterized protein YfaP (DUF2135 family)
MATLSARRTTPAGQGQAAMRRTVMVSDDFPAVAIETGDAGTVVLDAEGMVLASHGADRHEELVAERHAAGWRVEQDGFLRPPEAEGTPPPEPAPAAPAGEADGPSS